MTIALTPIPDYGNDEQGRPLAITAIQLAAASVVTAAGEAKSHTGRAYKRALTEFLLWYSGQRDSRGRLFRLSRALVHRYRQNLIDRGIAASSINQQLAAIRGLARELTQVDGGLSATEAASIVDIKNVPQRGMRAGHWLTLDQAQALLNAPNIATLKGLRDRAILAFFLGAGLRREEVSHLEVAHLQQREGRWAIIDMEGKHHRIRSIPIPSWCYVAASAWLEAAGITDGAIFRAINRGDHLTPDQESLSAQAIRNIVKRYLIRQGHPDVAPHDLRRTWSKLAHKGGASMEQIQLSLGHASLVTTQRYVGIEQSYDDAPADHLGLRLE